jgi:hypothetical protein
VGIFLEIKEETSTSNYRIRHDKEQVIKTSFEAKLL